MQNRLIEQIKTRLPITEALSTYITLEPSGTQFKARCPFHNEKTASFSVSPERGLYYCFGCGAKGDIFNFVEQFEGLDFKGALKVLADRAGIPLTGQYDKAEPTDSVYDALEVATKKYTALLERNSDALAYLQQRGLTQKTIEEFRIGYAPAEWRTIASTVAQDSTGYYERAGLIKKTEKGFYDRFRGRVMFPMMDSSGRIVAFSGRIFPDTPNDIEQGPKYLNSPETEIFQKSRILFGFDKAKIAIKKHNFAILVEGQMDLVLRHQAGFKNTVATSGTAVSETTIGDPSAQLSVIARLTSNIFLAFDGDGAGQKALEHAALVTLSMGMNPKVVALPEGMDPADYIAKEGTESWKELLKNSEHFIIHTLHQLQKSALSAHQLKQSIRQKLFPFLARVPSAIERNVYLNTIAAESNLGTKEVNDDFVGYQKESATADPVAMIRLNAADTTISVAERFVAFIAVYKEVPEPLIAKVTGFQFNDEPLVLPELADRERILAIVEHENKLLTAEEREAVLAELSAKVINQFLENLRFSYAMKMNEAKQNSDEEKELMYLALLQRINQHKHEGP